MASKQNEFHATWIAFHDVAVNLSHLLSFLPWQTGMARNATQRSLDRFEAKGWGADKFGAASGLSIIDAFRDQDWDGDQYFTHRAPGGGKRATSGDEILHTLAEVEARFNNSVLCSLHEALEVYLRDTFASMLFQMRNQRSLKDKSEFHSSLALSTRKLEGTPQYYVLYARCRCKRNCRRALQAFSDELDWSRVKQMEWRGMPWTEVADTLSLCRNFIAHDEGRVADDRWGEMRTPQREFIQSMMRESRFTFERHILAQKDEARQFLEAIVTTAYVIYVLLSRRFGMKIEMKLGQTQYEKH